MRYRYGGAKTVFRFHLSRQDFYDRQQMLKTFILFAPCLDAGSTCTVAPHRVLTANRRGDIPSGELLRVHTAPVAS